MRGEPIKEYHPTPQSAKAGCRGDSASKIVTFLILGMLVNTRYVMQIMARGIAIAVSVIVERNWKNYHVKWYSEGSTLSGPVLREK